MQNQLHSQNVDFCYEKERMKSFATWPVHFPVDSARLAKSGFHYIGHEDEVVCFSCQGHIKNWNYGDVVQKRHAELFPNCDFVNNRSGNVPIINTKSCINNNAEIKNKITSHNTAKLSKLSSDDYDKMKSESERLKSFTGKWPLAYIDTAKIAHAGFFYLGFEDKVQCPFCKGILSNWESADDPLKEHKKHFPWCDYISDTKIEKISRKSPSWASVTSEDVCGNTQSVTMSSPLKNRLLDRSQQHMNLEKLGVHLHEGPVHPQQATLTSRLRSFTLWPSSAPVSKQDLAEAGFFYIGISDHTKCFHCNGGLRNWEPGDDPWIEHARWFCNCQFLRLSKGDGFIETCIQSYHVGNLPSQSFPSFEPLMPKVDEAMKSNLVKYVLETGLFPPYIVRAAILQQIKETGSSFSSVDEMCIAVSNLKEEMESEPFKINNQDTDLNMSKLSLNQCTSDQDKEYINSSSIKDANYISTSDEVLSLGSIQAEEASNCCGSFKGVAELESEEDKLANDRLCQICMDREVCIVFLPCGHLLSCTPCAVALKFCPLCRKMIQATVRAYLP